MTATQVSNPLLLSRVHTRTVAEDTTGLEQARFKIWFYAPGTTIAG